ncbi:MAG: TetR/AcrR family transcriptional regulator [Acidimicrobiales bacterium]
MNEGSDRTDGRTARRDRNRAAVLDSIIELIQEGHPLPTVDQISARSGVSHRSVFRYFDDLESLFQEAVQLAYRRYGRLAAIHGFARGEFDERVQALVDQRLTLFPAIAPLAIAGRRRIRVGDAVDSVLITYLGPLRGQLAEHFAVELDLMGQQARDEVLDSLEVGLSLDGYDYLVRSGRTEAEIANTYRALLRRLLTD